MTTFEEVWQKTPLSIKTIEDKMTAEKWFNIGQIALKQDTPSGQAESTGSAKECVGGEEWIVHILGMDGIFPVQDEVTALRFANNHNIEISKIERQGHDPILTAIVYRSGEES